MTEFERGQSCGIGTQSVSRAVLETYISERAHTYNSNLLSSQCLSHWIMDNINEGIIYVFSSLGSNRGFTILDLLSSP